VWIAHPNVKIVREADEQWRLLKSQLEETGMAGNLTTDAHLASLAIAHGATLVSCDTDFGRFAKLRWENPLTA
jgi:predicted nucleic acid-binding protein